jgi:hypothetical protein
LLENEDMRMKTLQSIVGKAALLTLMGLGGTV